jgi:Na+-driven multidrug efflux pump
MIVSSFGFMLAAGGSALVGKLLGMKDRERANASFSLLTYACAVLGVVIAALMALFMPQVAQALRAEGQLLADSVLYGRILCVGLVPYMLQYHFQLFFITAEKPKLGLYYTVIAGCTNIVLDFLFVGVLGYGLAGAAWATNISQCIGGLAPLVFFYRPNDSLLRLGRTRMDRYCLLQSSYNGIAEFLASISASLVSLVFNYELLKLLGEDGVAAYSVIMYFSMVFTSIFFGYCIGVAPVISYHFGAGNRPELKN